MVAALTHLRRLSGTDEHTQLIDDCVRALELFRLSPHFDVFDELLADQPAGEVVAS